MFGNLEEANACKPHISVLIPAFNAERYVGDCLESLLCQTCPDFNIVIIDDGSTDETAKYCDEFCSRHSNAIVVHTENQGPLLARGTALAVAKGTHVMFLDADDKLKANAIENCYRYLDDCDPDILMFRFSRNPTFEAPLHFSGPKAGAYRVQDTIRSLVFEGNMNSMWGKVFRASLFNEKTDYAAFAGVMHGEDLLQLAEAAARCQSMLVVDDVLYFYRQSEEASTACYRLSQRMDLERVLNQIILYSKEWKLEDGAFACVVRNVVYLLGLLFADESFDKAAARHELKAFAGIVNHAIDELGNPRIVDTLRLDYRIIVVSVLRLKYELVKTLVTFRLHLANFHNGS